MDAPGEKLIDNRGKNRFLGSKNQEKSEKNDGMLSKQANKVTSMGKMDFWAQKIREIPKKMPKIGKKLGGA